MKRTGLAGIPDPARLPRYSAKILFKAIRSLIESGSTPSSRLNRDGFRSLSPLKHRAPPLKPMPKPRRSLPRSASRLPSRVLGTLNVQYLSRQDRRHVVEAFIVRLLKRVKSMSMAELLSALATDAPVNCRPDPSTVPAIVDDLVSREYLHRDGANPSLLHYNAY